MGELLVRREGAVGTILFSNVARHNAMTYAMWHEFPERLHELDADPSVRVIVLTGDGDQAFVSGADISQFQQSREEERHESVSGAIFHDGFTLLRGRLDQFTGPPAPG